MSSDLDPNDKASFLAVSNRMDRHITDVFDSLAGHRALPNWTLSQLQVCMYVVPWQGGKRDAFVHLWFQYMSLRTCMYTHS